MYRKGVSGLVMNDNQEFLLVNLESFNLKYFAVPGGGVEPGEELERAIYRELDEELGLKEDSLELVGRSQVPVLFKFKAITMECDGVAYEGSERYFFGFRFVGSDHEIYQKDGEVRTYKWVPVSELKHYLLFDNQLEQTIEKIEEMFS
ncbi:MAG: NUDIX hydrolase [Patescibacteria group bacterium]